MSDKKPYHMEIKRNAANQIHCDDGPAMKDGDHQRWFKNGACHRTDGPAIIHASGVKEFWENSKHIKTIVEEGF